MVAKKGSHLVRVHREQTERRKAQKSLDMAGTKMGNILGVEKKDDREDKGTDVIYILFYLICQRIRQKMGNILGVEKKDDREDKGTDVICVF